MTYELAKELKDAGFPQEGEGSVLFDPYCLETGKVHDTSHCEAYVPTLSELIEACGEKFGVLLRRDKEANYDEKIFPPNWIWGAASKEFYDQHVFAATPEEAVARLWLALAPTGVFDHD